MFWLVTPRSLASDILKTLGQDMTLQLTEREDIYLLMKAGNILARFWCLWYLCNKLKKLIRKDRRESSKNLMSSKNS